MTVTLDELLPPPAWPAILGDHLSASSLGLFGRCPEQFRRRYLLGEKERPGASLVWGNADHKAHEYNFAQKIESHEDVKVEDVKEQFAWSFDLEVDKAGGVSEIDWDDKPGDLKDAGVRLAAFYHQFVSPSVQPIAVEEWLRVKVPGVPVPVVGRLDVETEDRIIDGKTSKAKKKKPEPHWRPAAFVYQLAVPKPFEWHIKAKTKAPTTYTPTEEPGLLLPYSAKSLAVTQERVRRQVASLLHLCATFGADEPWPTSAPDYGWACGYCGFRPTCPWWAA